MSSDTLIQEVDEELRRDRMRKLWRQTGPWIIAGAVAVVLGVAAYEGWTWWQKTQSSASSDQFYAATKIADGTDFAAAKKALDDVIAKGSGGYPMLAQFREAALLAQQGKTDDAVAAYDALSNSINDTHLRELALVLSANLLVDKGDVAAVEQRVGGLTTPASALRNIAREEMGLVQYKAGKLDDAMKSFQSILDDPLSTRDEQSRIQIYMLQLEAQGAKPIAPPADTTTSSAPPADVSSAAPPTASSASAAPSVSAAPASAVSSEAPATASSASASEATPATTSTAPSASAATSAAVDTAPVAVTPPVVDNSLLQMAVPQTSVAPSETASSTAPAVSSSPASAVSSASAEASSAPVASSSASIVASSSAP